MKLTTVPTSDVETRTYPLESIQIRTGDGLKPRIEGYASVFNRLSEPLTDGWGFPFREKVAPGAFTKTLQTADVRALINHDPTYVLGRNKAGTLQLSEDNHGLAVVIDPPDTTWARDLMVSMERGDVNQMSFGFRVIEDKWVKANDDASKSEETRVLLQVALHDVSVVTFPAYRDTSASVRSILSDVGIDLDLLSGLIARSRRGLSLASEDHTVIAAAIDILRRYLPPTEPAKTEPEPIAAHSEPPKRKEPAQTGHSLAQYKQWLEQVEQTINC